MTVAWQFVRAASEFLRGLRATPVLREYFLPDLRADQTFELDYLPLLLLCGQRSLLDFQPEIDGNDNVRTQNKTKPF